LYASGPPTTQYQPGPADPTFGIPQVTGPQSFPSHTLTYFPTPAPYHAYPPEPPSTAPIHSGLTTPTFSAGPITTFQMGARPLPNVGESTTIPSSYSIEPHARPRVPSRPAAAPPRRRRHRAHPKPEGPSSPAHHLRTLQERRPTHPQQELSHKGRKPPEPFSSYAHLLGDVISRAPRRKMILTDIYKLLKREYPDYFPDYFPDDGFEDTKGNGSGDGWRVFPQH